MKVLIVDDHSLVRDALKLILGSLEKNIRISECGTFAEALEFMANSDDVDLVILDLRLPDLADLSGIEILAEKYPETPVAIFSGYYSRQDVGRAFHHGAAGFVPKSLSTDNLANAFRIILSGEKYIPPDILADPDHGYGSAGRAGGEMGFPGNLTHRQRDVLKQLMEGFPNKVIARELGIQEVTVKMHLKNIYKILDVKNRTQAVRVALRLDW